jgi:dTMP kinase
MPKRGLLVAIEGTDSSGKATQAQLLFERMQRKGFVVELVNLPRYHEFFGSLVGKYLAGEFGSKEELPPEFVALLYALDRYHLKNDLEKKLSLGINFVFNRYKASNLAHQAAKYFKKPEQELFIKWLRLTESRLPKENATVFLNMPEEAAQQLMNGKDRVESYRQGKTRDQHESDVEYLRRTREIYKRLARKEKWVWVDCAFKEGKEWVVRSKEEISLEIWKKLGKKIRGLKG